MGSSSSKPVHEGQRLPGHPALANGPPRPRPPPKGYPPPSRRGPSGPGARQGVPSAWRPAPAPTPFAQNQHGMVQPSLSAPHGQPRPNGSMQTSRVPFSPDDYAYHPHSGQGDPYTGPSVFHPLDGATADGRLVALLALRHLHIFHNPAERAPPGSRAPPGWQQVEPRMQQFWLTAGVIDMGIRLLEWDRGRAGLVQIGEQAVRQAPPQTVLFRDDASMHQRVDHFLQMLRTNMPPVYVTDDMTELGQEAEFRKSNSDRGQRFNTQTAGELRLSKLMMSKVGSQTPQQGYFKYLLIMALAVAQEYVALFLSSLVRDAGRPQRFTSFDQLYASPGQAWEKHVFGGTIDAYDSFKHSVVSPAIGQHEAGTLFINDDQFCTMVDGKWIMQMVSGRFSSAVLTERKRKNKTFFPSHEFHLKGAPNHGRDIPKYIHMANPRGLWLGQHRAEIGRLRPLTKEWISMYADYPFESGPVTELRQGLMAKRFPLKRNHRLP